VRKRNDDTKEAVVKTVLGVLKKYQSLSAERIEHYNTNKKWFAGDKGVMEWSDDKWMSSTMANILEANIRTIVAILTDSKPIMRVVGMPFKKLDEQGLIEMQALQENLDNGLGHVWRVCDMHKKMKKTALDGCLKGTMCGRVYWDKEEYGGLGEIRIEPVPAENIFFDPTVSDINLEDGSCDWFIYATLKPLTWFQYYWPGKKVDPFEEDEQKFGRRTKKATEKGLYVEAYKADYDIEEQKAIDSGGSMTGRKRKYPKGRKIIIGTKTLLEDEPLDVFPFIVEPIADTSGSLLGTDDVYRQIQLQIELNESLARISQNLALSSTRQTAGDDNCGLDMEEWGNEAAKPGMHFALKGGATVDDFRNHFMVLDTPGISQESFQWPFMVKEFMEMVTGVTKLIQGLAGKKERQTGFEIGKMLETATIRLRERAAHIEEYIRKLGLTCLEYMKLYYTEERDLWYIDEATGDQVLSSGFNFAEASKIIGVDSPEDFEFDVQVHPDSTLPIDLNSMAELAMKLKEMGVIKNAEVLKRTHYPDQQAAMPDEMPGGGAPMPAGPPGAPPMGGM